MMVMAAAAIYSLRKILQIRQLAALGRRGKIVCKLRQLTCRAAVSLRLRGLCGGLQIRRNLLGDLRVFSRIRLL